MALREARAILRDNRADDAAQEATLRAWRHAARCLTPETPAAWVRAIARREALRVLAAAASTEALAEAVAEPGAERSETVQSRIDVARALEALTPDERHAIAYRYWLDYTQSQAAAELGVPEGTMKIRLHRARHKLKEVMSAAPTGVG